MKTEYPGVDWLLNCEPRIVQLEALARSYTGVMHRRSKNDRPKPKRIGSRAAGFCFFMEMRLGKTNVALNEWLLFRRDNGVRKLFILAPNRYKAAWRSEAAAFGVDSEVHVFESSKRQDAQIFIAKKGEVLVANYEALVSDANLRLFSSFIDERTMVIADESVLIKNKNTQFFKNALMLTKDVSITRILTGKPIVQGPHDLWSQMRFARQLDGWNYYAFRNTFCKMGGFMGKQIVGEQNTERLRELLHPCSFVAYRTEWGTSFKPDYEIRKIEMLPEQKKVYHEMEQDFITWLDSGQSVTADQVITKHIKLQQISSGFIIDENKKIHALVAPERLPKLLDLIESLETQVLHKAIVICYYRYTTEILLQYLSRFKPALIAGGETMKKLGLEVESEKWKFNTDPQCRVIIGQIQAVKYGHMLMGSKLDPCQTTFYYENTYSLDDRAQSEQRNQGEGQTAGIHIIDYASSRVEREIVYALERKENIATAILGNYRAGTNRS